MPTGGTRLRMNILEKISSQGRHISLRRGCCLRIIVLDISRALLNAKAKRTSYTELMIRWAGGSMLGK